MRYDIVYNSEEYKYNYFTISFVVLCLGFTVLDRPEAATRGQETGHDMIRKASQRVLSMLYLNSFLFHSLLLPHLLMPSLDRANL